MESSRCETAWVSPVPVAESLRAPELDRIVCCIRLDRTCQARPHRALQVQVILDVLKASSKTRALI